MTVRPTNACTDEIVTAIQNFEFREIVEGTMYQFNFFGSELLRVALKFD